MKKIKYLRERLSKVEPIHDTPIGLVHPYWARKPLNIIEEIILALTKPGDLILDPFMGSGTTIFGAFRTGRKAIGTDLNPLSLFIVTEIIKLGIDPNKSLATLKFFIKQAEDQILPLYETTNNRYIERERYVVEGDFEFGNFNLLLKETITKEIKEGKWKSRRVENSPIEIDIPKNLLRFQNTPIDFSRAELIYNSRIAIPQGATIAQYYSPKNLISLNILMNIIETNGFTKNEKLLCKLLISSSLPLLRLSDKKASNQWPYWRPKQNLTSRNPISILHDRFANIEIASKYLSSNGLILGKLTSKINNNNNICLGQFAVQKLPEELRYRDIKLILTDPPYSDHVPYLEYSAFWNKTLGLPITSKDYKMEIVNTDAPSRKEDTNQYNNRLKEALVSCSRMIADDGIIIWFYQDQELCNWRNIYLSAQECKLSIADIIPIKKQRRSIKTVTSPNSTLDGDLIIVFTREKNRPANYNLFQDDLENSSSYYNKYIAFIREAMLTGSILEYASKFKKVNQAIKKHNYVLATRKS